MITEDEQKPEIKFTYFTEKQKIEYTINCPSERVMWILAGVFKDNPDLWELYKEKITN